MTLGVGVGVALGVGVGVEVGPPVGVGVLVGAGVGVGSGVGVAFTQQVPLCVPSSYGHAPFTGNSLVHLSPSPKEYSQLEEQETTLCNSQNCLHLPLIN